jgi:hypothetical protein
MRDLALLAGLFVAAVVIGLIFHPLVGIVFLLAAKVVSMLWTEGAAAYRSEMAAARAKPKRKHILTEDGEQLDVVVDETPTPRERQQR